MIIYAFMPRISRVWETLCPNFRAFKIAYVQTFVRSTGKLVRSKVGNLCVYVPTIVRSKVLMSRFSCIPKENSCAPKLIFCAFKSRLSCVRMALYADFRALKTAYVLTFVRSIGKLVRSKTDNLCVYVQTIVRSKDLICRLSCVQNCLCPDFCAFQRKIRALQNW